ncbi:MAG: hypothetical protein IPO81_31880 [Kouleothrix sp.]|nr:hypothetical protein [Kouleothrix sp.]
MYRRGRRRWLVAIALVGAFLLLWNRLHIVFLVQLNLWSLLALFLVLAIGIYAALKLLLS